MEWKELQRVTTKEKQLTLKEAMKKIDWQNFDQKLGINGYDSSQLSKFRDHCKVENS